MKAKHFSLLVLILAATFSSCQSKMEKMIDKADRIEYRFEDSSVPPEYHRSYNISVTKDSIKLTVDVYGDIINEKSYPSDESKLNDLREGFLSNKIEEKDKKKDQGCSGGTTDYIYCYSGEEKLFSAWSYMCGKENQGTMTGDIESYSEQFKALIPNLSEELK